MGNENGFVMNVSDKVIGMHDQVENPFEPFSTGGTMRRSPGQSKVFDNNGGTNKAAGAGTLDNFAYGPTTFGGGA